MHEHACRHPHSIVVEVDVDSFIRVYNEVMNVVHFMCIQIDLVKKNFKLKVVEFKMLFKSTWNLKTKLSSLLVVGGYLLVVMCIHVLQGVPVKVLRKVHDVVVVEYVCMYVLYSIVYM